MSWRDGSVVVCCLEYGFNLQTYTAKKLVANTSPMYVKGIGKQSKYEIVDFFT